MMVNRLQNIIVAMLVAFAIVLVPSGGITQQAFAGESGISFEKDSYEFTISEDSQYNAEYISVETEEGVENWESSNESVVEISYGGWDTLSFYVNGVGTSTITATGYDGSTATCTITVIAPDLVIEERSLNYSVSDHNGSFDITSGYGLSFKSSNESVLRIDPDSYDASCYFDLVSPGQANITVTDIAGKSDTVSVNVSEAEWSLDTSIINCVLSDYYGEITVDTEDWYNEFSGSSSNPKVVKVDNDCGYGTIGITYEGVGTATITVRDKYGKTVTCTVNVKPDSISFGEYAKLTYNSFETDDLEYDEFRLLVYQKYQSAKQYFSEISADGGWIDLFMEKYSEGIERNYADGVWEVSKRYSTLAKDPDPTYEDNVAYLRDWCAHRAKWLESFIESPFADVTLDSWQYPYVKYVYDNDLMIGKGKGSYEKIIFAPNVSITRAEVVQVLYNKEGRPDVVYQDKFTDVPDGQWYTNAIIWASEKGIVAGKGERFDVSSPITRQEMTAVLQKYAQYKKYDITATRDLNSYTDAAKISDWAKPGMQWAVAKGIMSGKGDHLDPLGFTTRAEAAAMLKSFIETYK